MIIDQNKFYRHEPDDAPPSLGPSLFDLLLFKCIRISIN